MSSDKALFWSSCGSGNEGSKNENGEGVSESVCHMVCHDGVKQLAAAVKGAGWAPRSTAAAIMRWARLGAAARAAKARGV